MRAEATRADPIRHELRRAESKRNDIIRGSDSMGTELLTTSERGLLTSYETVVQQGLDSFVEVGNALAAIRDGRLYRESHQTFEAYCVERWNLSKSRAYQFLRGAEVVERLAECTTVDVMPDNEAQVRPLASLPEEQQAEAWKEAVESAPVDDDGQPQVTAKHVEAAVERRKAIDVEPIRDDDPAAIHEPECPEDHELYRLLILAQDYDMDLATVIERWPYLSPHVHTKIRNIATDYA